MAKGKTPRTSTVVPPNGGRMYDMGRMRAIFKADGEETAGRTSVSEWWLEPRTSGPPLHKHPEDHVYYVLTGTLSVCINDVWSDADAGAYIVIPGGTPHTFENRATSATGFITFNSRGGFESHMPGIAAALGAEDLRLDRV